MELRKMRPYVGKNVPGWGRLTAPAWAILEYGWYPLLLFAFTPWFLHRLGADLYGQWMLLSASIGLGGVLNAGTGAATTKAISAAIGRRATDDVFRAIKGSIAIAILGGGVLAVGMAVLFWVGAGSALDRMGQIELVRLTGIVAGILLWLEQVDVVFSSGIKGAERFGHAARVEMFSKSAQVFGAAAAVLFSPTLWSVYAVLVCVSVLRLAAKIFVFNRLLGAAPLRPSLSAAREILVLAKWGWLQGVGGVLFGTVDRLLIGSMLGAASLTYYSIASQLAMQVHAISAAGTSVIFPKVSRILESGRSFSLRQLAKMTMAGNVLLSGVLALLLIVAGPAVLRLWVGPDAAVPTAELLTPLVIAYWILALNVVFYYLLLGMGKMRFVALTVLASGAAGVAAAYVGLSTAGLTGAPAGRLVYAIASLALAIPLVHRLLKRSSRPWRTPSEAAANERLQ